MQTSTTQAADSVNAPTHNVPSRTNTRTSTSSGTAVVPAAIPANAAQSPVLQTPQATTPSPAALPSPSHASSPPPSTLQSTSQSNVSTRPTSPSSPGTTQQPQPVQASTTSTPTVPIPGVENGAAGAAPSSTPTTATPAKLGLWHRISSSHSTRFFRDCKYLILASCIYALALGITLTVKFKYTLLGAVPFGAGVFFLTLISKGGDIAFALAVAELLDNVLWGRIARKDIVPMQKMLAMSTSTGLHGLWSIIRPSRKSRGMGRSRYWAVMHSFAILLVPGPGLLLMASVNPENYYFPTDVAIVETFINGTFDVSAGIAAFQPAAAVTYAALSRFDVPILAQAMLQDTNKASSTDPIDQECEAIGRNCSSSILSGGLLNVKPWPNLRANKPVDYMIVENVPAYQFDTWPIADKVGRSSSAICTVYGRFDPRFELCIDDQTGVEGRLNIWSRICPDNFTSLLEPLPDLTVCGSAREEDTELWPGFPRLSMNVQIWNRTATHVMSTRDGVIQELRDLGEPRPVAIQARDLVSALDMLLWPSRQNTTDIPSLVQQVAGSQISNTLILGNLLHLRTPTQSTRIGQAGGGRQVLCNMALMPLYMFHSLYMGDDTQLGPPTVLGVSSPQPGLGKAFYVPATYAYDSERPTPAFWTILAYAGVGGFILLAVSMGQMYALRYPEAQTSAYPLLDLGAHLNVYRDGVPDAPSAGIVLSFPEATSATHVLQQAQDLRIAASQSRP